MAKNLPGLYLEDGSPLEAGGPLFNRKEAAEALKFLERFNRLYPVAVEYAQLSVAEQVLIGKEDRARFLEMAEGIYEMEKFFYEDFILFCGFFTQVDSAVRHRRKRVKQFGSAEEVAHG